MMLVELGWIYHASHSNLNSKHTTSRPLSTSSYIYISLYLMIFLWLKGSAPIMLMIHDILPMRGRHSWTMRGTTWIQYYQYVFHSKLWTRLSPQSALGLPHISFTLPSQKKKTIKSHVQAQRCATAVAKATCWWLVVIILTIIRTVNGFCIHLRWSIFHKYPWIWGVALDKHVRNGIALECIFDIP